MKKIFLILFILFSSFAGYSQCTTVVVIDTVSVLPNGDLIIGWQPSPDVGIISYDIYYLNPNTGAKDSLDAVNSGTTFYIIPYDTIVKYQITEIVVVANCGAGVGTSPFGINFPQAMILTNQINFCSSSTTLNWTAYDDFNSGTNVLYQVFVDVNGSGFMLAGTTNSLTYTYNGLVIGSTYRFFIRAVENNGAGPFTSSSNIVDVSGNFLKDPNFLYLFTATVIDSSQVLVQFFADTAADIKHYNIKRALSDNIVFSTVYSVSDFNGMNPLVSYYDESVDAKNNSYIYEIEAINQCNQSKITSNIAKTIKLTVVADIASSTNQLNWTFYEDWQGTVKEYQIYRQAKDEMSFNLIATIPASTTVNSYIDDVTNQLQGTGEFCYKILAIEQNTVHVGNLPMATSVSGEVCVKHEPFMYIANAFEPLSEFNATFKPSAIFFDLTTYQFIIFDRWGQKVFETNNRDEGWNGKFNNSGNNLPMGAYVYFIQFNSNSDKEFQKRGTVTLIR
ncbi:MAG: gliding motility-associated C-terminal domain-containing protein [Bacteroidetes bacterium]|nr:gliding motility-associated C-terminal domain-containing protein [Bacteroidota bacterium]